MHDTLETPLAPIANCLRCISTGSQHFPLRGRGNTFVPPPHRLVSSRLFRRRVSVERVSLVEIKLVRKSHYGLPTTDCASDDPAIPAVVKTFYSG